MSSSGEPSSSVGAIRSPNPKKKDFTHFISLPLGIHHPEFVNKLNKFRKSILEWKNLTGMRIDPSLFTKPRSLHFTVLMLELSNDDDVAKAEKVLQDVSSKLMETLKNRPVSIRLRGLKCMGDTPLNRARVVYAPPVVDSGSEERLLSACHVIIDAFAEAGLVDKDAKDRLNLKLHVTLMNTTFRRCQSRENPDYFDAQSIFEQFGSEEWGEYAIREAHLSQKGQFADEYFYCCASVSFPETCK
ncbi:uncharacterized protein LOC115707495 isoform X2 [Cannabis sativa]|uniref:uncharacterized protein LOC115707495 isoform X2 n=1 Tax=Cannabis sativa TaxID=3483 RepID=UPI0029C9E710|nr:uncharacterized protein LOC115707495 isoform X2 [Cannabis sativa]